MSKKPTEEPKKSRSRRRRLLRKPGGAKTKKPKTAALSSKSKETEKESTSLSQLNWHTFDVIVSLQLFGAGIFLLLAFIGGIVGTDGFWWLADGHSALHLFASWIFVHRPRKGARTMFQMEFSRSASRRWRVDSAASFGEP
ncbi:hypothetical protein L596_015895 [Steinernema carpocapsae]|uniref:Uncharacterized protein n=1 Tax=Steinernema carpocapsae TaxID=34508 RepID=A0A4U5NHD3_STECR|nr:hypothetical protein L596_015895 [Steinernema carpocapsae]